MRSQCTAINAGCGYGVLRLMAAVIHSLWEKGDRNPLILPSTIPMGDARVQFELTRYLADNWVPIIEKDVDGPSSLPLKIDREVPNLGKLHATRRVARTIFLGSAPTAAAAHRGLEDRRVKLGCVMPGESAAVFGDALRRLASAATYLYQDGPRAWYATQPTVTKLADDRAEQLKRDPDKVAAELEARVRADRPEDGRFLARASAAAKRSGRARRSRRASGDAPAATPPARLRSTSSSASPWSPDRMALNTSSAQTMGAFRDLTTPRSSRRSSRSARRALCLRRRSGSGRAPTISCALMREPPPACMITLQPVD